MPKRTEKALLAAIIESDRLMSLMLHAALYLWLQARTAPSVRVAWSIVAENARNLGVNHAQMAWHSKNCHRCREIVRAMKAEGHDA